MEKCNNTQFLFLLFILLIYYIMNKVKCFIRTLNNTFKTDCTYNTIKEINKIKEADIATPIKVTKMRNIDEGIELMDAIYYKFRYTEKTITKQDIVSEFNYDNKMNFTLQAYYKKESHIPVELYMTISNEITKNYNKYFCKGKEPRLIAIDGTYNNNSNMDEILNLGFYDIGNCFPIEIKSYGKENKNNEINCALIILKSIWIYLKII